MNLRVRRDTRRATTAGAVARAEYRSLMTAQGEIGDRRLLDGGISASAVVMFVRDTPLVVGDRSLVLLELEITTAGAEPYRVRHRTLGDGLRPGVTVPVRVDPVDRDLVTIDGSARG
ncbi:hypothetical protein [Bailinhaonella thermotolerans]|uniref:Uncharacterized protein n=1 Tax=Bailinhaonella thermotolerans TaxID=1070861 RepID=A0A3A4AS64_9ACTN|nr:hypothetical protein [Bailinhaonella thermotolerans]RJL32041.1 hypothetical protein D5H75_16550 [Bailinhaonella thermotolerans]